MTSPVKKRIPVSGEGRGNFRGFKAPASNTTYTPNQFFDVCLRNAPRGVVRMVAFLIRKSLGWCDENGDPHEEEIVISYKTLRTDAGISRDMIRETLDIALSMKFAECVRSGIKNRAGESGESARFRLRWDCGSKYQKDPQSFDGFYEQVGNRTYVPNEFFDVVVANERLAVIKVVGAIIRSSIGFEAKRGHRRRNAVISFTDIQRFAGIRSRSTLNAAIQDALRKGYITRVVEGVFSHDKQEQRRAEYAIRWEDGFSSSSDSGTEGSIREASDQSSISERSENRTRDSQKIEPEQRSENRTRKGQIPEPERGSENRTSIKIKHKNKTSNKDADAVFLRKRKMLLAEGINKSVAERLAENHSTEEIERQIGWIDARNPRKSRSGLLKHAIEENFEPPMGIEDWRKGRGTKEVSDPRSSKPSGQAREDHEALMKSRYLNFLRSEEERIKTADPDGYDDFVLQRVETRESAARSCEPWFDERYFQNFDSESSRLRALREHFDLPDFWSWDGTENPHPFVQFDSIGDVVSKLPRSLQS